MNREEYIKNRLAENHLAILYTFAQEKGYKFSKMDFATTMMQWSHLVGGALVDYYLDKVCEYYDKIHNLTLCFVNLKETEVVNGNLVDKDKLILVKII